MLVTCVTILAIDFAVFPRRYGKTETYGTGLVRDFMSLCDHHVQVERVSILGLVYSLMSD